MRRHLGLVGVAGAVAVAIVAYTQIARTDSTPQPITARGESSSLRTPGIGFHCSSLPSRIPSCVPRATMR